MDPNRREKLSVYESNAQKMYRIGFFLLPFVWLVCWIYCNRRRSESELLRKLGKRSIILFWAVLFVFGVWTTLYDGFWPDLSAIGFILPNGEPE